MKIFLKIVTVLLWIGLLTGATLLMSFAMKNHNATLCKGLNVDVIIDGDALIPPKVLQSELVSRFGDFKSKRINDINLFAITNFLKQNPYCESVNVNMSVEGVLMVRLKQREPIVRIYNTLDQQFYLDRNGFMLPIATSYAAHVAVANGDIDFPLLEGKSIFEIGIASNKATSVVKKILHLANVIANDTLSVSLIEQIYISDNQINIISKAGKHIIQFGDTANSREKFENLFNFYRYGLPKTGWDKYHTLDLRFKNKVVCKK